MRCRRGRLRLSRRSRRDPFARVVPQVAGPVEPAGTRLMGQARTWCGSRTRGARRCRRLAVWATSGGRRRQRRLPRLLKGLHARPRWALLRSWSWRRRRTRLRLSELVPDIVLLRSRRRRQALCRILIEGDDLGNSLRVRRLLFTRDTGVLQQLLPLFRETLHSRETRCCQADRLTNQVAELETRLTVNSPVLELKPTCVKCTGS